MDLAVCPEGDPQQRHEKGRPVPARDTVHQQPTVAIQHVFEQQLQVVLGKLHNVPGLEQAIATAELKAKSHSLPTLRQRQCHGLHRVASKLKFMNSFGTVVNFQI